MIGELRSQPARLLLLLNRKVISLIRFPPVSVSFSLSTIAQIATNPVVNVPNPLTSVFPARAWVSKPRKVSTANQPTQPSSSSSKNMESFPPLLLLHLRSEDLNPSCRGFRYLFRLRERMEGNHESHSNSSSSISQLLRLICTLLVIFPLLYPSCLPFPNLQLLQPLPPNRPLLLLIQSPRPLPPTQSIRTTYPSLMFLPSHLMRPRPPSEEE